MTDAGYCIDPLLEAFVNDAPLRDRLSTVLHALPGEVLSDFLHDPRFRISRLEKRARSPHETILALPGPDGSSSRCVVLKARLAHCSESFGLYVIAHELAHAYLRNGSWGEIEDREDAADALAATWGFPRPKIWGW